jgi:hypothetical protein
MQYSLKSDRSDFSTIEKRIWSDRAIPRSRLAIAAIILY